MGLTYASESFIFSANEFGKVESMQYSLKMLRIIVLVSCVYAANAASINEVDSIQRIIGGESISIENAPYQVSIINLRLATHMCGGSIISKDFLLTAAHCAEYPARVYRIRSGSSLWTKGGTLHKVTKVIQHEDFDIDDLGVPFNDIALMKVSPPFKLDGKTSDKVQLFDEKEEAKTGDEALLTGWGLMEFHRTPRQLQSLKLQIMDTKTCFKNYLRLGGINKHQICAKYPAGHRDMCNGDSGGPLVIDGKQVGIVSWSGPGCAKSGRPGVYTEVAAYRDWIDRHVKV